MLTPDADRSELLFGRWSENRKWELTQERAADVESDAPLFGVLIEPGSRPLRVEDSGRCPQVE